MESNIQLQTKNEQIIDCKELEAHPDIVEMKYINILKQKDEMLVFIDENSYHPIEIIQLDSFERILQLLGKNLNEGIDLVMFRFHSIDEIKEFKQIRKNNVGKENDYEFDYQKELNLNLVKCKKLKISEICFDNLWIVENELNKIKEREKVKINEQEENELKEDQEEKDKLIKEQEEKDKLIKEQEERDRLIKEQEERDRLKKEQKEINNRPKKGQEERDRLKKEQEERDRLKKEQEEKDRLKKEQEEKDRLKKEQEEKDRLKKEQEEINNRLKKEQEEKDRLKKEQEEKDKLKKDKEYIQSRQQNKETKPKINSTNLTKKQLQNKPKTQSQTNHKQPKTVTKIIPNAKKPNQTTNSKPTANNQNFKKQPLITSTNHSKPKNLFPETKRTETETTNSIKPFSKKPITARPKPNLKLLLNTNPLKTKPINKHKSSSTKKDSSITELDSTLELNHQPLNTTTSINPVTTKKRTYKASSMDTKQTIAKTNKNTPLETLQQFITSAPTSNTIYPTHTQYNSNKKTPHKPISSITTNSYPINSHCLICKGLPVRPKECIQCHKQYCLLCTYELKQYNHCDECNGLITHIQSNSNSINQTYEANITRNNQIEKSNESKKKKVKHLNLSAVEFYNNNRDRYFTEEWRQTLENDNKYHSRINSVENNRHNNNKVDIISPLETISNSNQKKAHHHLNNSLDLPEHKQTLLPSLIKRAPIQKLVDKTKMKDTSTFKSFLNKQHNKQNNAVSKYFKGNIIEKKLTINQNDSILSICYIPSFSFKKDAILTGHSSGDIFMWDTNKGNKIKTFCEHISKVYDLKLLQFNSNKSSFKINFISISEDKTIKIWDSSSQHSLLSISQLYPIYCIDNINSNSFITGDKNKNIYIHQFNVNSNNITKGMMIKKHIEQHSGFIWRVLVLKKLNKTNKHYFISSSKNNLILHQLSGDHITKQIDNIHTYKEAHDGLIKDITELSFGKFASCGVDNTIKIWEYNKMNCIHIITDLFEKSNNSFIYCLLYLNDYDIQSKEDVIICCGNENKVKVIGLNGKDIVIYGEFIRPEPVHKVKLLTKNDKYKFMSINNNNNLYLWGLTNE